MSVKEAADYYFETAKTGINLEEFKSSDAGKHMYEKAKGLREIVYEQFRTADANNVSEIQALQNQLQVADMYIDFLDNGIQEGQLAREELERLEQDY